MKEEKKSLIALLAFVFVTAAVIVLGICLLEVPVVPLCVLVILEAGIAVMLHHAELWIHAVLVIIEMIAGAVSGTILLTALCAVVYACATGTLMVLDSSDK